MAHVYLHRRIVMMETCAPMITATQLVIVSMILLIVMTAMPVQMTSAIMDNVLTLLSTVAIRTHVPSIIVKMDTVGMTK
jgi:hypothetical protein